jgi:diguanylate cyclase (GGDEF)-like protein
MNRRRHDVRPDGTGCGLGLPVADPDVPAAHRSSQALQRFHAALGAAGDAPDLAGAALDRTGAGLDRTGAGLDRTGAALDVAAGAPVLIDSVGMAARVAQDLAAQALVQNALEMQLLQQRLLAGFGQMALGNPTMSELMTEATNILGIGLQAGMHRLLLTDPDGRTLRQVAGAGWDEAWTRAAVFDATVETEDHFVIGTREAITIDDFECNARLRRSPILIAHGARSAVEVLICGTAGPYGVIGAYDREPGRFDRASANFVQSISNTVAAVIDRNRVEKQLSQLAQFDALTALPNRAMFMDRLNDAVQRVRSGEQRLYAVLFLDFDRFKLINDTLGHDAGDELLRQIAARLKHALRFSDAHSEDITANLVARFGGDEFLVLLNDLRSPPDASRIADRLLHRMARCYDIFGTEVRSTASVGLVTSETGETSSEDVIRNADVAMYEAKRSGRACTVIFTEAMQARVTRHVAIETSLRRAIGTPALHLVYQPIIELASGRMTSAEALVRWNDAALGSIPPAEFIPIAEESDLIVILGRWVLREACRTMAFWLRQDPQRAPETISVNVSRAQLALGKGLLADVRSALEAAGLPERHLQLEVTEREVMRNPDAARDVLLELRASGIRLAMDDFGTGTSSLAALRDFPFDTIKIDRSFLINMNSNRDVMAVIRATVSLVENLGMSSLAEGVEAASQATVLQSLGCHYAQGYLFSRPVPADRLLHALDALPASLAQAG